jgi:phosphate starvation-inducible PhoH-like protein
MTMGKRISRTTTKNQRIAQQGLANLLIEPQDGRQEVQVKHYRANPDKFQKRIKPKTPRQAKLMQAIDDSLITFGIGPAGTGKTFIAVRKALEMLATNSVSKIVLSRPAMEAEGERIGFLPGSMEEKLHPYMLPIYDILKEALGQQALATMMENGTIELCPLGFMRGRTFTDAVIILDEMQNATRGQMKMALTRMGEGTRAIVTGDPDQSDLEKSLSGLLPCAASLSPAPGVSVVRFENEDVVRSKVVATVLEFLE